jgi:hypothetical protein
MKILLLTTLLFLLTDCYSAMVNGTIQISNKTKSKKLLYSVGALRKLGSGIHYGEGGLLFLPNFKDRTKSNITSYDEQKDYVHSLYGAYAGYHLAVFPILRPGIVAGSVLRKDEIFRRRAWEEFSFTGNSDYTFAPYFGLSLQAGVFTFLWTNFGIGGGICLNL